MRDQTQLIRRNKDIDRTFNSEYKELKSDPDNAQAKESTIMDMAISRTAAKFYLSIRTIERVIKSPQLQTV